MCVGCEHQARAMHHVIHTPLYSNVNIFASFYRMIDLISVLESPAQRAQYAPILSF